MPKQSPPQHVRDNRANQLNPQHPAYHRGRGATPSDAGAAAERARVELEQRKKHDGQAK